MSRVVKPLQDALVGRRVRRTPPYKDPRRTNTGEIVGFFHAHDPALDHPSPERTHVRVRWDDGVEKNVHPSALRVIPRPPAFRSMKEADDWLAANAPK